MKKAIALDIGGTNLRCALINEKYEIEKVLIKNTLTGSLEVFLEEVAKIIEEIGLSKDVVGIVKAYTTRVGEGPFVTELDNEIGEEIRIKGREFGTVTGRSRRCGWFDAVIVRYASRVNGLTSISLMLLDVLTGFDKIQVCTAYKMGDKIIKDFPASLEDLAKCEPIYEELEGWTEDITSVERFEDLPENAKKYVAKIEELIGVSVDMVSVGPNRAQTIVRRNVF